MRADATLLLLDKGAVEQLLTPDEVTQAVREAFVLHARREGRVFPVVREKLATGGVLPPGGADLVTGANPIVDPKPFNPGRFSESAWGKVAEF